MKLIDKLPSFYEECPKVNSIQEGLDIEINDLYSMVKSTVNQLYINSATWALGEWEKFAGLKNSEGTIEQRRTRVSAKLKAKGATTLDVMTSLCKSYVDDAKITELFNEYTILLELISNSESFLPKEYNIASIDKSVWEIKPAHLAHKLNIIDSRAIGVKTNYEDIRYKYIPCNAIYAGELQANTYFKNSELCILPPSNPFEKEVI